MIKYQGQGVSGSIAIGKLLLWKKPRDIEKREHIDDIKAELDRVIAAKSAAAAQLEEICERASKEIGRADAQLFEVHRMMLEDDGYNGSIRQIIENQSVNAEYAVAVTAENYAKMFASMDDEYMQARAADVRDISKRLIANLKGNNKDLNDRELNLGEANEKVIICADDISPSEAVSLDREKVCAIVTVQGSYNSHTAILARSMNIPAIVGAGEEWFNSIYDRQTAIVDGNDGIIILNPDEDKLKEYELKKAAFIEKTDRLKMLKGKENVTMDGTKIDIYANIGGIGDIEKALDNDAGGVGLFRSEFLFLDNDDYPSEDYQVAVYKSVLEKMAGKKVIIRTLDIGADKQADYFGLKQEANPALGLRGIRVCLTRPKLFKTQLRALYRASVYGNLGIMFPMISSEEELLRIRAICEEVKNDLNSHAEKYSDKVEIGIMIETPAAAIISDKLAPMVDFFSVGTNDLTQYALACDRQNHDIKQFLNPHHEAILRLIEMSTQNAHSNGIRIGICGELAADTTLTESFLKMGIDELSVSPTRILQVRETVRGVRL